MTRKEFAQLASAIKTFYPRDNVLPNNQALELWYGMLSDIPYMVAEAAVSKWVATQKWPPTIAELRELSGQIIHAEYMDWATAWEHVMAVISRYGWYGSEQALGCFDEPTRETVKRIGFEHLCHTEATRFERDNFKEIYENIIRRRKADDSLPVELKLVIKKVRTRILEETNDPKGGIEKKSKD